MNEQKTSTPEELESRLVVMERHVRNMRLAVIVIAAFFIYESLAPDGFRERTHTLTQIETRELRVVDDRRNTLLRLGEGENGAVIVINDGKGARATLESQALSMRPFDGDPSQGLDLTPDGVRVLGLGGGAQ